VRFPEFLRVTVLISAAAASVLAVVTVAGAVGNSDHAVVIVSAVWWVAAAVIGVWLGRGGSASRPIASLLADARTQSSLPELNPGRIVLNRLWPLLVSMIGAGAVAFVVPQVPGVATGFAIIWALAWRQQSSAVIAIEERDGARFYIEPTSPLRPIKLVRTPGFRAYGFERGQGANGRTPKTAPRGS
jgi:hypothetical protein